MTLVPWWCLFLHVTGLHGHIYRHGKSWNGYGFHTYPHPANKPAVPRDIMVDVINDLGLKLLAIHNEYNENNVAISPYGALSVLVALGEGLEGDAVYEIHQATHIPNDISVIRVGLRDIHRHLKSYFIPKEGFLAGLTLNHENVTLRSEYEDILRFYGYDTATFNNALYPQPDSLNGPETTNGDVTTTEPGSTTVMGRTDALDMTTESMLRTTIPPDVTTTELTIDKTTTLPVTTTILVTTESTSTTIQSTTTTLPQTTEVTTIEIPTTTKVIPPETTTDKATTSELPTTAEETTSSITTTVSSNAQEISTEMETTQPVSSTTENISTTQAITSSELPTTTSPFSTTEPVEAGTTTEFTTVQSTKLTTNIPTTLPSTIQTGTSIISETTVDSTTHSLLTTTYSDDRLNDVALSTTEPGDKSLGSTNTFSTDSDSTSTTTNADTTTSFTTDLTTIPNDSSTEKDNKDNEIDSTDSTTESVGFGGVSKRKIRSGTTRPNSTNVVELNMGGALLDTRKDFGFKRTSRSVVDYILARYYDDQFNFHNSHVPYIPEDPPSFLVYGKYREYNINCMKYNTVLPFHYEPHLDALALSFPLDSTKYYLLLLLPVDETGIDKLICDLRLNGSLKYIIANLKYRHVIATIPSFTLKGYVTLTPNFQKLGIRKVFEPRQADFSPMTNQRGIYVTNIEQAITVTIRNYMDPNIIHDHRNLHRYDPVHFKADHPFLYFVIDSDIHVTLMAGKIVNPLNSRIS